MTPASPITELNAFLAQHKPVACPTIFAVGTVVDEWRVTAFLGSGGNAEVYRVVRIDGTTGRGGPPGRPIAGLVTPGRGGPPGRPQPQQNETLVEESVAWQTLCKNITTNLTVQELVCELLVTNTFDNSTFVSPERAYRQVQKATEATIVRLNGVTNTFTNPIRLKGGREYWVTGPGILDGIFFAEGTNVMMRLRNCIVRNHAAEPLAEVGINYDLQDGAGLELPELDEPDDHGRRYIERSGSPTRLNFKKRDWGEPITWKDEEETGL